ncbi:MAG: hypothetical protein Q9184_004174 [Pyrenodesmia sp. 2 TL-2023]
MDVSRAASRLLGDQTFLEELPRGTIDILRFGSNKQYLDVLARLALQPSYISAVFSSHQVLLVEICSRWLEAPEVNANAISILAALARILPAAPYLSPYVTRLFQLQKSGPLQALLSSNVTDILTISQDVVEEALLVLLRLLLFDNETFAYLVSPAQLQLLLSHSHRPIRYLAVRLLCLYLHASESALQEMVRKYLGEGEILGQWEGKEIDYIFFSLWEDKRLDDISRDLRHSNPKHASVEAQPTTRRYIKHEDLSPHSVCLAGVLLPNLNGGPRGKASLVMTPTVENNLQSLAEAIKSNRPVLLTGSLGAGKSSLVRETARMLGCDEHMLVLHLNEQTDAKLLVGMYTTAGGPGSFTWQPGVLTKAVTEGRWVFIEDFDRAPAEIVSMILPLLERRELLVPHWGRSIRASPSFRLIATIRSSENNRGEKVVTRRTMIGARHWEQVHVQLPPDEELGVIIIRRFPLLHAYRPRILGMYSQLVAPTTGRSFRDEPRSKVHSPQDLLGWSSRINDLLKGIGLKTGNEPIPESTEDNMFLEAVDCFAGSLPDGPAKEQVVHIIAQELQISRERVSYCLEARKPEYKKDNNILRIGRASLLRKGLHAPRPSIQKPKSSNFATTNLVLRHLESVAVAINMGEPCLLVGETGTGKTTIVQQLAESLGKKLEVVNLSQQSEAGDLLGGFKPVNMRSLAIPMKERFEDLFESTFSLKKNQRYVEHIAKAISKDRWSRALTLWREAVKMVELTFTTQKTKLQLLNEEPSMKKRKLGSQRLPLLKSQWEKFGGQLDIFQKHLESGSKGFAFCFVEGNIVKAARNGDWVLLDEINLAAADTLDSLADLLTQANDGGPSLLLTETGETERVRAHKDFRIFGAMNPANDVGKRDLPLSLRSRFFELFIEAPDKDLANLVPVVQAYLGNNTQDDIRAASDVAQLYLDIQSLAQRNCLVDGADQKPHYSLRTLTRTLMYVIDITPMYGLRRALFEGFSMSFLTLLNQASIQHVTSRMETHLQGNHNNIQALLRQTPKLPPDAGEVVKFKQYWMSRGPLPIRAQAHYIITPFVERNLLNLMRATSTRRFPVLLQGPTSSGKTSMVEHLASISGHKFVRINNHEHTDLQEYLGTYVSGSDGQLQYQEGILVQALREGFWIVLDELNLAPTDVLEALNRLLDDNRELFIPETQQIVRPHRNFMLFATQNPPGIYGGRKVLSRAFRNRFLELHFEDIPEDELQEILCERSQIAPSFCAKIVAVYKKLALHRQHSKLFEQKNSFATLRDLFRWASRDADDREQLAINGYYLLAERVRNDEERRVVKSTIEEVMKTEIDDDAIYDSRAIPHLAELASASYGIVWTRSMRRLYVLVTEALKNQEPVLLVGETGSGKTTICQVIASAMQNHLRLVNAHQNMETGDLIGSQRPVRSRQSLETRLNAELRKVLLEMLGIEQLSGSSLQQLIAAYQDLPRSMLDTIPSTSRKELDEHVGQFHALFEWVDGSLVHAMKAGQHFLLDEISLADDSVLERLNSVLEPARTLFLAEKGVNDASVVAAQGFQFLATMNPGGDYGKKELSPALRNRFTEVWVPHASARQELEEILEAKLGESQAHFAKPMVAFAQWYGANFSTAGPETSIRDLLAWVTFLNTRCIREDQLSILHGAALVYIDTLGANPSAKLHVGTSAIDEQRQRCLDRLSELFHHDMKEAYLEIPKLNIEDARITTGPFSLDRCTAAQLDRGYNLRAPTTLRNTMKIARALQLPRPILMEGSPGVGKTTLVTALAQACGMPLTRINLSDQTDLMDLFGSDVPVEGGMAGQFEWRDAPFLRAMQKGEWVLLDEMNLASQSVLEGLNACFDHRGQVYVSELDQTFSRHPNFVVFAAQNPHHQGSGRKGLPASFVNRFTVVYADVFVAEDLLTICSDKFSNVSPEIIEMLTQCVTALGDALQPVRRLGMNGGPWEINLRDTTRWLDLLSSLGGLLPAAKAQDLAAMLFLLRFRTSEDVTTISNILQRHLPGVARPRHRVFGVSATHLQMGLGLLCRDAVSSSTYSGRCFLPSSHLPYVESVLLCVQKGWPCLLVGPSGSGKTEIIRRLAHCAGADLIEFSMNSSMDTTDLVGGYEQLDSERETTAFLARFRAFVKETMLSKLQIPQDGRPFLTAPHCHHAANHQSLAETVETLRKLVDEEVDVDFDMYLRDGEAILQKASHDNRARFEWVDGILVKAMTEGSWLVLDNANLCSASVLDRLNSLLEPNGVLNINERHSEDGSVRVVKPHPNFRLFMTMDPQHGELSRAMRNRNVELFISKTEAIEVDGSIDLTFDSATARFAQLQKVLSSTSMSPDTNDIAWICLENLALADLRLVNSWLGQVSAGLIEVESESYRVIQSVVQLFERLMVSGKDIVQRIQTMYHMISRHLHLPQGFEDAQTVQPLNNPLLIELERDIRASNNLLWLGMLLDLLISVGRLEYKLEAIVDSTGKQAPIHLSPLQKSIASTYSGRFGEHSTQPIAPFVMETVRILRVTIERSGSLEQGEDWVEERLITRWRGCLYFIWDLVNVTHSTTFDEAVFQVYLGLGQSLLTTLTSTVEANELEDAMKRGLGSFAPFWQLRSGQSMEVIWSHIKPPVPTTLKRLKQAMEVEDLAQRFDAQIWTLDVPLERLERTRQMIAQLQGVPEVNDDGSMNSVERITNALHDLEAQQNVLASLRKPYLQPEFEALRQHQAASPGSHPIRVNHLLGLLSGEPTRELLESVECSQGWQSFNIIERITGSHEKDTALATVRSIFPISILEKMVNIAEVPLGCLDLLQAEMTEITGITAALTASMTGDQYPAMLLVLERLHRELADVHRDYLQSSLNDIGPGSHPALWQLSERLPPSHYLRGIVENYLEPSWELMAGVAEDKPRDTASAWILFFSGCLKLYVPDRPYDPALKPMVMRDRHQKRMTELNSKLFALRYFEKLTTGQSTNLRCQLVEKELEALGNEPTVEPVLRPNMSEIGQLQGEFNNILQSIVKRSLDRSNVTRLLTGDSSIIQESELLRSNITQAVFRLRQGFRTYNDITKPLVTMLYGLDAGLAMAQIAQSPVDDSAKSMEHVCRYTPFLGMRPSTLVRENFELIDTSSHDLNFKYLASVAVMDSNSTYPRSATQGNVFKTIHGIYEGWKKQLSEDQRKDLARSSMYRYRGGEADADANNQEAFNELFPDHEASDIQPAKTSNSQHDPRTLAQRMARQHRDLLEKNKSSQVDRILQLMQGSCADIARTWQDASKVKSPVPAQDLLCGVILDLDKNMSRLSHHSRFSTPCNFYTDANIAEAQKLVNLARRLQGRFFELKQAWPEHATLDDVLRTSSDLLALRHTEPVAKLITKLEQLHGYVYEWQTVASREYSASALYEQLTSLIVQWRRLELTTWSRLFDMEDKRCREEVDSWWFVAYEVIVAAPLSILESGDDLPKHVEELFVTLQGFLVNTSVGHFSLRLGLLETFRKYVRLIEQTIPGFKVVQDSLSNFLAFYSRYTAPMQQVLHTGKIALEKEMKDVLLLASWKDTNVNALRASAKRSHHKLFKVVRKYRALLARPAQNIIDQGFPEFPHTLPSVSAGPQTRLHQPDSAALKVLEGIPYAWSERPARFRNITTTVSNMVSMSQIPSSATEVPSFLDNFVKDLTDDIKALRKETPVTATDNNAESIKHLTSRKRKLFFDTLKSIRHMGFRTNLSGDVLSSQASTAIILSRLPPIKHLVDSDMYKALEYHLHHFLDLMPAARQASRTHSEDLSGTEVNRSVGYLESMLSHIIRQRTLVGESAAGLANLDRLVEKVQNVWKPGSYRVMQQSLDEDAAEGIEYSVSRLSYIIDTGCVIIEKHGKLGKMDHSELCGHLRKWSTELKAATSDLESKPNLPSGLTCSQQRFRRVEAQELVESFKHGLHQLVEQHPGLAFVLKQILLWTETYEQHSNGYQQSDVPTSLTGLDQALLKTCDSVLVTIQNLEKTMGVPVSTEDLSWLVNSEVAIAKGVKALHIDEIRTSLEDTVTMMHTLSQEDLTTATALTAMVMPIIQQYRDICHSILDHVATRSKALNNMAAALAKYFCQVAAQGFCKPSEAGPAEAGKNEKLEEGTGLGEGEGAEDISKDIQDDEDLTELAQEDQKSKEGGEIEDEEDAVNMDQDELEGELGDAPEKDDDREEGSEAGSGDEDIDEETGDVDGLDPNAVDEKLWDDDQKQSEKEKEGEKAKGAGEKDDQPNVESDQKDVEEGAAQEEETLSDAGADEGEEVAQGEPETIDPHAPQEENLDLPDEMDLDGQEKSSVASDIEDSDQDGLSDAGSEEDQRANGTISDDEAEEEEGAMQEQAAEKERANAETEESDGDQANEVGSPLDTDPEADDDDSADEGLLPNRTDDANIDENNVAPSDAQGLEGQDANETTDTQMQESKASGSTGATSEYTAAQQPQAAAKEGELGNLQDKSNDASEGRDPIQEDYTSQAFKKLGNALETWHRQQRQIQAARSSPAPEQDTVDVDMTETEFQHLENEYTKADTQALGAATEDQAHVLDQRALDSEIQDQPHDFPPDEARAGDEDTVMEEAEIKELDNVEIQLQSESSTFIGPQPKHHPDEFSYSKLLQDDTDDTPSEGLPTTSTPNTSDEGPLPCSLSSARALWMHHSASTLPLSHLLTSQLRLILSPTLATAMRGDFRTGKRLNIKKIIPYIASGYKRDKIWMRRSVPSKRNYQIMLAIDDSRSMSEAGSADLAFETLALVANALQLLEAGEVCVVGFGEEVRVAHPFGEGWDAEKGAGVFRQFGFEQKRTDVRKLLGQSLRLFREARQGSRAANADEVWQLMFIISDGICEDHEVIRRQVRQAQEERIMIVFVIVDKMRGESDEPGTSIMDMNQAVFVNDGGEKKLIIKRYMDGFPFGYYLVVGDVRELPAVLGQALRGWFGEVVGRG